MHKYKGLFFSLLLFLYACGGNNVPSDIIQPNEMTALLTQVHITDGSMYNVMQVPDSLYKYGTAKYLKIFKDFHTDSLQFKKSMQYYTSKPELLVSIYEVVVVNLKQKSDSLNKITQAQAAKDEKRRADSLKKLPKTPVTQIKPVQHPPLQLPDKQFPNKRYLPKPKKNVVPN